jgi:hypothetical protein
MELSQGGICRLNYCAGARRLVDVSILGLQVGLAGITTFLWLG